LRASNALLRSSRAAKTEIDAIIAHTSKASLRAFYRHHWPLIDPAPLVETWAVDAFADHLQAVSEGLIKFLLVNIPPRFLKSSLGSVLWPAWVWAQDVRGIPLDDEGALVRGVEVRPLMGPQVGFYCATYAQGLSLRDAARMRDLVQHPEYQERYGHSIEIQDDQNEKRRFVNNKKGYRFSTSFDGQLTGDGGDIILIDDPHNASKVESDVKRQYVIDSWESAIQSRRNNAKFGAFVVIMQRVHAQDLSGHILAKNNPDVVHLCLPMEFEPERKCYTVPLKPGAARWEDPRTKPGELLSPRRFSKAEIDKLAASMGSYNAAGQLQQRPAPKGGAIIKVTDWKEWNSDRYPKFDLVIGSLDSALGSVKSEAAGAYSALTMWGLWQNADQLTQSMLIYAWHERAEFGNLVRRVHESMTKYAASILLVENKANGVSIMQELRRLYKSNPYAVHMINPDGDKVARAHAVTPMFEDGKVWAPKRKWADEVIVECGMFPRGQFKDYVDSTTQALFWLRGRDLLKTDSEQWSERREAQAREAEPEGSLYGTD
jgi:predicted phage terminase large subunit-like protein